LTSVLAGVQVYNQRLKHVLSEHRDAANALKADGVTSTVPLLSRHAQAELELRREALRLQAASREQMLHGENELTELKLVSGGRSAFRCEA